MDLDRTLPIPYYHWALGCSNTHFTLLISTLLDLPVRSTSDAPSVEELSTQIGFVQAPVLFIDGRNLVRNALVPF